MTVILYNRPTYVDGVVVTKYREGTPPQEMRRLRAVAKELARQHSDVWYWDWKNRKKIYL
jgi:hypothetical protein